MPTSPRRPRKNAASIASSLPPAELVVVAENTDAPIRRKDVTASLEAESHLNDLLPGATSVCRVFGAASRLQATLHGTSAEDSGTELLNTFTVFGSMEELTALAETLIDDPTVAYAYVKPPAEPPIAPDTAPVDVAPAPPNADAPPVTADFTSLQGYLDAAPGGVDARWAWTRPGGRGDSVRVIDVEGAWRFSHEDLLQNQGGVIGGTQSTDIRWRNHGTAVVGEIGGDVTTFGITGIAPNANVRAVSIFGGTGSAGAIRLAADALSAGDVILIELHRPGPRNNYAERDDQNGYIAIEWWPDDFAAIRYALGRGVIVVEAAGNGAQNFDDPLYETRPPGFPTSWRNPLRASGPDSGAIIVGAGAPPPGTNGQNHGPARSRLDFSNYGARVDVQGWGREVVTTGYGDLQGGGNEDLWYTRTFSGTSSASPIVTGAVAAYQGILAASSGRRTPQQIRDRLRQTGSAQQDAPGRPATQRIGTLPDLRGLAGRTKSFLKDAKQEKLELKDAKLEKAEVKELKTEKLEFKEQKKEKIEKEGIKEFKHEKLEIREFEQKIPDIDFKISEWQEDLFRKQLVLRGLQRGPAQTDAATQDRLDALEHAVSELSHFIAQSLRPDLSLGALGFEDADQSDDDWQTS